jgi:choloylglycine hydrolase
MKISTAAVMILLLQSLFCCTIIYTAAEDTPWGGANEDYNDPYIYMTVYPPEVEKLGWIKFSFGSGFPQAGMNEAGVFWDGASAPWLDMPYSVNNKELYDGPLMQKVIEECSNCQEAQDVFAQYYCSDQFNAQYLVGDSTGISMIVEGDDIVINQGGYQVLTNFNVNHPDMGGYPCWRYDTAMEMLAAGEYDIYQMGFILSATHQEGQYPTLYSNIFDLVQRQIYLFYQHNFNEYIIVDLQEQFELGYNRYLIGEHFSCINYRYPEYDGVVNSTTVEISWQGCLSSIYELQYSLDPNFTIPESIVIQGQYNDAWDRIMFFPLLGSFLLLGIGNLNRMKIILAFIMILLLSSFLLSCSFNDDDSENNMGTHRITLSNLEDGSTYYWRVLATREGSTFSTETTIFPFTIELE